MSYIDIEVHKINAFNITELKANVVKCLRFNTTKFITKRLLFLN